MSYHKPALQKMTKAKLLSYIAELEVRLAERDRELHTWEGLDLAEVKTELDYAEAELETANQKNEELQKEIDALEQAWDAALALEQGRADSAHTQARTAHELIAAQERERELNAR